MRPQLAAFLSLICMSVACGGGTDVASTAGAPAASGAPAAPGAAAPAPSQAAASNFVEGKDYLVLERRLFLDEAGFDRPVEAFSLLFPRGWTIQGGVKWVNLVNGCRADGASNEVTATSADGTFRYQIMPSRSFLYSDDQSMMQIYQAGAQSGGCELSTTFDAERYMKGYAQRDLQATASDITVDEPKVAFARRLDAQANQVAAQYGNQMQQQTSYVTGKVTWPNGDEGVMEVGVSQRFTRKPNMVTGGASSDWTTSVLYHVLLRFPAARRDEGAKLFHTIQSSYRQNPVWQQVKTNFMTQLGNIEHAGRMDRLRLQGEQAASYAKAQSEAQDRQMRSWELRQDSQDRQQKAFVQTIREVETWRDSSGPVELSSGYGQAWSRGNGSYILSNSPTFDPSSVFQDQRWTEMKRERPGGT